MRTDKDFAEYVKDKRIAIVGNAESLFYRKTGAEIDSHDLVIRINRPPFFFDDRKQEYDDCAGKRMDLLLMWDWKVFLLKAKREFNPPRMNEWLDNKDYENTNIFSTSMGLRVNHFLFNDEVVQGVNRDEIALRLQPDVMTHRNFSTGTWMLFILDLFEPSEVNIFGFDWKRSPTFNEHDKFKEIHPNGRMDLRCAHWYEEEEEMIYRLLLTQDRFNLRGKTYDPSVYGPGKLWPHKEPVVPFEKNKK